MSNPEARYSAGCPRVYWSYIYESETKERILKGKRMCEKHPHTFSRAKEEVRSYLVKNGKRGYIRV
jgi:hypothetical protein